MIRYSIAEGGLEFRLAEHPDQPWVEWGSIPGVRGSAAYAALRELVDNGRAEVVAGCVRVDPWELYATGQRSDASDAEDGAAIASLGLPAAYPFEMLVSCKGLLHTREVTILVEFYREVGDSIPVGRQHLARVLNLLVDAHGEPAWSLTFDQFSLLEEIDAFNGRPASRRSYRDNLDGFAQVKRLAERAGVRLHATMQAQTVVRPERIVLDIRPMEGGGAEVLPALPADAESGSPYVRAPAELNAGFQQAFDRRTAVDPVITVQGPDGQRVRIPLADTLLVELRKIKSTYRRLTNPDEVQDLIEHPERHFNPEVVDYSVLYSGRVIEIGLYRPRVYPFVCPYRSEWIPGFVVDDQVNGDTKVAFRNEAELGEFRSAVMAAEQEGRSAVQFRGCDLPIEDARTILAAAERQFDHRSDPPRPGDGRVLIIKENAELLEYEDDHSITALAPSFEAPPGLASGITLRVHQKDGIAWMQALYSEHAPGCLLADDMGLGKTLQVLCFLEWFVASKGRAHCLVVAPASVLENWAEEYHRFFPDEALLTMGPDEVQKAVRDGPAQISAMEASTLCLLSYEGLRAHQLSVCAIDWGVVVLDEAQRVKTPGRMVTNAAKALKAEFRIALTGTPVENSFHDLWCIMDFCVPGLLGSAKEFSRHYGLTRGTPPDEVVAMGERLRRRIGVYLKRRLKADVLSDLPPKHLSDDPQHASYFAGLELTRDMPEAQRSAYLGALRTARGESARGGRATLQAIHRIRWISDHPRLYDDFVLVAAPEDVAAESARLQILGSVLDRIRDRAEKALLFAELKQTQRMLARFVAERYGAMPSIVNGDTPSAPSRLADARMSRQQTVAQFSRRPGFGVLIMSPVAAGIGLNAAAANHVIHYSRHWNPAKEDQATDRAYRIGQVREVFVYYPLAVMPDLKTFDVVLAELLRSKRHLAKASLYPSEMAEVRPADVMDGLGIESP